MSVVKLLTSFALHKVLDRFLRQIRHPIRNGFV
jgi:hypothetical protein